MSVSYILGITDIHMSVSVSLSVSVSMLHSFWLEFAANIFFFETRKDNGQLDTCYFQIFWFFLISILGSLNLVHTENDKSVIVLFLNIYSVHPLHLGSDYLFIIEVGIMVCYLTDIEFLVFLKFFIYFLSYIIFFYSAPYQTEILWFFLLI